jgi:hypothetical protein
MGAVFLVINAYFQKKAGAEELGEWQLLQQDKRVFVYGTVMGAKIVARENALMFKMIQKTVAVVVFNVRQMKSVKMVCVAPVVLEGKNAAVFVWIYKLIGTIVEVVATDVLLAKPV